MDPGYSDEPFVMSFPDTEPDKLSKLQSLDVVQVFLNAAVACIAYTRELLPWTSQCFQIRHVDQLEVGLDNGFGLYRSFCDPQILSDGRSQEFRIFRRGFDKRADTILDMLVRMLGYCADIKTKMLQEYGIYESITLGYLKAIQIFITVNTEDPAAVLECYTFTFKYDQNGVSQVQISPRSDDTFSVKAVKKSFTTAIKSLLRGLTDLPSLPRRRSLGVSLTYNDACPPAYQPSGFIDVGMLQSTPGKSTWASLWQDSSKPFTQINTGKHCIIVGAKSLTFSKNLTWSQMQDMDLSNELQNMQIPSSRDAGLASTLPNADPDQSVRQCRRAAAAPTLRQASQQKKLPGTKRKSPEEEAEFSEPKRYVGGAREDCVDSSQTANTSENALKTLAVRAKNRRRRNVVPSKLAELLVQARAMENEHNSDQPLFDQDKLKLGIIRRTHQLADVKCECRSAHMNDDMLYCELCGTWQHKKCYGYVGLRPGSLPEEHFCYSCLLLPREDQVNNSMPGVVQMRLALIYLAQLDHSTVKIDFDFHAAVFPERTNSATDFLAILQRLCDEGYVTKSAHGLLRTTATAEKIQEGQTAYLDPLAGITQHYEVVRDGERPEARKTKILQAVKSYFGDRDASYDDEINSAYDAIHIRDNSGSHIVRWGFYANWKPKGQLTRPVPGKASISECFLNVDRSTPSEGLPFHEALGGTVEEADWLLRRRSKISPVGSGFA